VGLAFLLCAAGLTACGAEEADPSKADIGKTLRAGNWEVTLAELPEKRDVVGEEGITYQAEGTYLIAFLQVSNTSEDILLFPPDLVKVRDSQGREFVSTTSTPQFAYQQTHRDLVLLIDSPVPGGATQDTFLIFDIARGAKDLSLTMEGTQDTLGLGY
jgi:hypothetical protein